MTVVKMKVCPDCGVKYYYEEHPYQRRCDTCKLKRANALKSDKRAIAKARAAAEENKAHAKKNSSRLTKTIAEARRAGMSYGMYVAFHGVKA